MLDLEFIRKNSAQVKESIAEKGIDLELDEFLKTDSKRRTLIAEIDELRKEQNAFNKRVASLSGEQKAQAIEGMKTFAQDLKAAEKQLKEVERRWLTLYLLIPNLPAKDVPVGDEGANREVGKWGQLPKFDFKPKSHTELSDMHNLVDFVRGVKVSGFRGYYLKNEAVLLQLAILMHAVNRMRSQGFELMIPPTILKDFALIGSGHFPFSKDDIYELANVGKDESGQQVGESLYLSGTSEPALLAYFADTTLKEEDLPVKVCGFSQCYRNEVGSYGKDAKGLYRLHEFMKVEQVVLCRAEEKESDQWLEKLRENSELILRDLGLPYRVMMMSTGEMGAGVRKMYDIETWMPSRGGYGETHSDSNLTDWQPRRLNIKYRSRSGEKKYVYALNNTVIASPRILIAVLENFQNKDGTIDVPKVLFPYCGLSRIGSVKK